MFYWWKSNMSKHPFLRALCGVSIKKNCWGSLFQYETTSPSDRRALLQHLRVRAQNIWAPSKTILVHFWICTLVMISKLSDIKQARGRTKKKAYTPIKAAPTWQFVSRLSPRVTLPLLSSLSLPGCAPLKSIA